MIQPTYKGGMNAPHLSSLITATYTKIAFNFLLHPSKPWTQNLLAIIRKRSIKVRTFPKHTFIDPFIAPSGTRDAFY